MRVKRGAVQGPGRDGGIRQAGFTCELCKRGALYAVAITARPCNHDFVAVRIRERVQLGQGNPGAALPATAGGQIAGCADFEEY